MRWMILGAVLFAAACNETNPNLAEEKPVDTIGQPPDTLVASPGPKACEVVGTDELQQITGLTLKAGRTMNDYLGVSQCQWDRQNGDQGGVSITVRERGDMSIYKAVPGSTPVTGIGDEAVWAESLNQLAVRVGERVLSVSLLFPPPNRDMAEQIAREAIPRLEG